MSSGNQNNYKRLREMYFSGTLTAVKFPVHRIGYKPELLNHLQQVLNTM